MYISVINLNPMGVLVSDVEVCISECNICNLLCPLLNSAFKQVEEFDLPLLLLDGFPQFFYAQVFINLFVFFLGKD